MGSKSGSGSEIFFQCLVVADMIGNVLIFCVHYLLFFNEGGGYGPIIFMENHAKKLRARLYRFFIFLDMHRKNHIVGKISTVDPVSGSYLVIICVYF